MNTERVRRLLVACALAALSAGSLGFTPASAAITTCDGFAPSTTTCAFTVTLEHSHPIGVLKGQLFTGLGEYTVSGPSGRVHASCYGYPAGVFMCDGDGNEWPFLRGETISISVTVTGVGDWSFTLTN